MCIKRNWFLVVLFCTTSSVVAFASPPSVERKSQRPFDIPTRQPNAGWAGDSMINYSGTVNTPVSTVNIDLSPVAGGGGSDTLACPSANNPIVSSSVRYEGQCHYRRKVTTSYCKIMGVSVKSVSDKERCSG